MRHLGQGLLLAFVLLGTQAKSADDPPIPAHDQLEASGAVIGSIVIDAQNIFDLSDPKEDKRLFRLANRLHVRTRERVVRQQLLFQPGDRYSQRSLEESERILRAARYIYDASVRPIAYHDGVVDVAVITRDVWTLNPGLNFGRSGGKNTFGVQLDELNILGTGSSISAKHESGLDRDTDAIEYKNQHLAGRWLSLTATLADSSDGHTLGLSLDRPFYALATPFAAGFSVLDDERTESLYDRGEIVDQYQRQTRWGTAYAGWSRGLIDGWTKRWTLGATYEDSQFGPEPDWSGISVVPDDRKLVYPWLGFDLIQDDFEKLRNRDQIGRTEDFHLGTRVGARLGWAADGLGSDRNALMFSGYASHGVGATDRSTLLLSSTLAGRMKQGDALNTKLAGSARYYLQQSRRLLFFATLDASIGHELDLDNQVLLGGDNGLRGYPLRYQVGSSSALLSIEERYFTDWYPFRLFRIGAAAFVDVGKTWGRTPVGTPSLGVLKDVGIGLRIGNSRSGLGNIIHVDLAFPLDGDSSIKNVQFLIQTKESF